MKKRYILTIEILMAVIFGIIGGVIFVGSYERKLPTQGVGSLADWVSGLATVSALIFAYVEIKNSREQFEREHQPQLMVYTGWKDPLFLKKDKSNSYDREPDLPGVQLHIIPVNKGLAAGIYRYLGICKREDLVEIYSLVEKAKDNNINAEEVDRLAKIIYYDLADVGQDDQRHDVTGMSLLYPDNNDLFRTIESNHVGKIINKKQEDIVNKLEIDVCKDVLEVIYIDLNMKIYPFEVKTYKEPESPVKIGLVD